MAAALGVIASYMSIQLMARHRQAELLDARWLARYEEDNFGLTVHGREWRDIRNSEPIGRAWRYRGYQTWRNGLMAFGLVAFATLLLGVADPSVF